MKGKNVAAIVGAVIVLIAAVVLLVLFVPQTAKFRQTFMKKCEDFPQQSHGCEDVLGTFEDAYVGKNLCNFPEKNYDPLLEKIPFTHASSKTMLWSDTKPLVHDFTKKRDCFITLEDSLLGYVLDNLKWCGLKGSKETFTMICNVNKNNPVMSFWKNASARFAAYASGEVTAMLNGDKNTPYHPNSIFASIEVKKLQPSKVTRLNVVLVTDKDNTKKCSDDESLRNLQNELKQKGIGYNCKEVTRSHIQKCIQENNTCGACW